MRTMKFDEMFSHDIDGQRRETWPKGWPEGLEGRDVDDAVAFAARKAGCAHFVGSEKVVAENEAWFEAELAREPERLRASKPIPLGWEDLAAAPMILLARELGADKKVATKKDAQAYIEEVVLERAGGQSSLV